MNALAYTAPDFGHPLQPTDELPPLKFELSPAERHVATMAAMQLEANRRAANKRDEARDLVKLGVVFEEVRS